MKSYIKNKSNNEIEFPFYWIPATMLAILLLVIACFFIEEVDVVIFAIIIIVAIPLLIIKEKVSDKKFPYIYCDESKNKKRIVDVVACIAYTVINNSTIILGLLAFYVLALLTATGQANLRSAPELDGNYVAQEIQDSDTIIFFDDKYVYTIDLLSNSAKDYSVGSKYELKLSDNSKFRINKVEKK